MPNNFKTCSILFLWERFLQNSIIIFFSFPCFNIFASQLLNSNVAILFQVLLEHRDDLLAEYYYPESMLFSEEATLLQGLLVSLNIVDFNIIVKVSIIEFGYVCEWVITRIEV